MFAKKEEPTLGRGCSHSKVGRANGESASGNVGCRFASTVWIATDWQQVGSLYISALNLQFEAGNCGGGAAGIGCWVIAVLWEGGGKGALILMIGKD